MTDAILRAEVLGHGFIELIDHMGDDLDIINNAKVSFDRQAVGHSLSCPAVTSTKSECNCPRQERVLSAVDRNIQNMLMRDRHGSPWERPEFVFRVKAPIFIMREWHRHRIAELNEESMRYSIKKDAEFYVPAEDDLRRQVGRPGNYSFEPITDPVVIEDARSKMELAQHFSFRTYHELVDMGVAKEQARIVIPVGAFSTMIWKANLRSIMNFLSLRGTDPETGEGFAQKEIRAYADPMEEMVAHYVPHAIELFNKHGRVAP